MTTEVGDILWHNGDTNETQIWFMDGNRLASRATVVGEDGNPAFVGLPFRIAGIGDMNGNGKADIVWHNGDTNETQIWFMDGNRVAKRGTVVEENGSRGIFVGLPFSIVGIGEFNSIGKPNFPTSEPGMPDAITLNSGSITSGLSIGGFATLIMTRGGQFTFTGHMHDSGALGIDFLLTLIAMTPSGIAYSVQRSGHTAGTLTPGSRDDDWTIPGFNELIRDNWKEASQARLSWTMHANDTLTPQLGKALEDALQEALKALGKAAVTALIALL
jgi:hypothetical protein